MNAHADAVGGAGALVSLDPDELSPRRAASRVSTTSAARSGAPTTTCCSTRSSARRTCTSPDACSARGDPAHAAQPAPARRALAAPPRDPARADPPAGLRGREPALGHLDPARAARARPRHRAPRCGRCCTRSSRSRATRCAQSATPRPPGGTTCSPSTRRCTRTRATSPNECIFITLHEFLSDHWGGCHDVPTYQAYLAKADQRPAYRYHRRFLQTLQQRARGERWLLKAPSHLFQLRALFDVYPEARIVQTHRDPLKTIPSALSLMGTLKWMRCEASDPRRAPRPPPPATRRSTGARSSSARAARCPTTASSTCATRTSSPTRARRSSGSTRRSAGASRPSCARRGRLRRAQAARRHGVHHYSLAEMGLDAAVERKRFAFYCEHFGVAEERRWRPGAPPARRHRVRSERARRGDAAAQLGAPLRGRARAAGARRRARRAAALWRARRGEPARRGPPARGGAARRRPRAGVGRRVARAGGGARGVPAARPGRGAANTAYRAPELAHLVGDARPRAAIADDAARAGALRAADPALRVLDARARAARRGSAATRRRAARGARADRLHLGHDGPPEGRRALARQPARERRVAAARVALERPTTASCSRCRCSTCTASASGYTARCTRAHRRCCCRGSSRTPWRARSSARRHALLRRADDVPPAGRRGNAGALRGCGCACRARRRCPRICTRRSSARAGSASSSATA